MIAKQRTTKTNTYRRGLGVLPTILTLLENNRSAVFEATTYFVFSMP